MTSYAFITYRYFGTLRFMLASLVMFHHFAANVAPMRIALFARPLEIGSLAVLVFFCLSGFVIGEATDTIYRGRPVAFMSNRLMRVFPHFLAALVLSIVVRALFVSLGVFQIERMVEVQAVPDFSIKNLFFNFFDIVPGAERFVSYEFIGIAWAVRTEMVFYGVVAFCLLASSRRLPFTRALTIALVLLSVPYGLSVLHYGPATFGFVPYFGFGVALYFMCNGQKSAKIWLLISSVGIFVQFLSQPDYHPVFGFRRDVSEQLIILCVLIATFVALATVNSSKFRMVDNQMGKVTYPLYMYHFVILVPSIFLATYFGYNIIVFISGMTASMIFSVLMAKTLDPIVDRVRDLIRGERL